MPSPELVLFAEVIRPAVPVADAEEDVEELVGVIESDDCVSVTTEVTVDSPLLVGRIIEVERGVVDVVELDCVELENGVLLEVDEKKEEDDDDVKDELENDVCEVDEEEDMKLLEDELELEVEVAEEEGLLLAIELEKEELDVADAEVDDVGRLVAVLVELEDIVIRRKTSLR